MTRAFILFIISFFVLISCSNSPTGSGATPDDPVVPDDPVNSILFSLATQDSILTPGQIRLIQTSGTQLTSNSYEAQLSDGSLTTLYKSADQANVLLFIVPEVPAGNQNLVTTIDEQEITLEFKVAEYEALGDPDEYISAITSDFVTRLDSIIENSSPSVANSLIVNRDDLNSQIESFNSLSDPEKAVVARIIDTNFGALEEYFPAKRKQYFDEDDITSCDEVNDLLESQIRYVVRSAVAIGFGSVLLGSPAAPIGVLVNGLALARILISLNPILDTLNYSFEYCYFESDPAFEELSTNKIFKNNSVNTIIFNHNEAKDFKIKASSTMDEGIITKINEVFDLVTPILEILPDEWSAALEAEFNKYRTVNANNYEIFSLLGGYIDHNVEVKNDSIFSLTFAYSVPDSMPLSPRYFGFDLVSTKDNTVFKDYLGQLYPPYPTAYDAEYIFDLGATTSFSFNDTLFADSALSFAIETGLDDVGAAVQLVDPSMGEFRFIYSKDWFSNSDLQSNFTFSSSNGRGVSNVATATVSVSNDFKISKAVEAYAFFDSDIIFNGYREVYSYGHKEVIEENNALRYLYGVLYENELQEISEPRDDFDGTYIGLGETSSSSPVFEDFSVSGIVVGSEVDALDRNAYVFADSIKYSNRFSRTLLNSSFTIREFEKDENDEFQPSNIWRLTFDENQATLLDVVIDTENFISYEIVKDAPGYLSRYCSDSTIYNEKKVLGSTYLSLSSVDLNLLTLYLFEDGSIDSNYYNCDPELFNKKIEITRN